MTRQTKKNTKEEFGERIDELLRLSGETLQDFASALKISIHSASAIINGKAFPKWHRLKPIAEFLRVDVWDLFDNRPERKMPPMLPKQRKPRHIVRKSRQAERQRAAS